MTHIAKTERLLLRHLTPLDADFYLHLVNEPAWKVNIGDRQVQSLGGAQQQITDKLMVPYARHGFGLYLVAKNDTGEAVGICGLVKRESLHHPDIGFAFLQEHWRQGYAFEAARAVLDHAFVKLDLSRVLGITTAANERSARLLIKLGLRLQGKVQLGEETRDLYQLDAGAVVAGMP